MKPVFAQRLTAARKVRGLTQIQLATMAELDPSKVSKFEAGSVAPSLGSFRVLVNALNVSADYLLGLSESIGGGVRGAALATMIDGLPDHDRAVLDDLVRCMARRAGSDVVVQ